MEPNALHIWPRGGSMMIALPNRDGTFTCTLFWPFDGEHSFAGLQAGGESGRAGVRAFFEREYPDAMPLMPTLVEDFQRNPVSSLVTVRCSPWSYVGSEGKTTAILGDAAHAIVPFYGQGMNCAFEDVRVLAELLGRDGPGGSGSDLRGVLKEFERARKPNADAIADMALENFVEMRDKTARPEFLYKKRVEQAVHEMFPGRITPQYNLVSFSTVPYAEAQRRGRAFDAVLERIVPRVPMAEAAGIEPGAWKARVKQAAETELAAAGM
jgi:kynurenine 3-monooxygenase